MTETEPTTPGQEFYNQQFVAFVAAWKQHRPCLPLDRDTIRAGVILFIDKRRKELLQVLDGDISALVDDSGEVIFRN